MADTELSDMTAAGTLTGTELIYGTQSDADRKLTPAQIKTFALSPYGTLPATDGTDGDVLTTNGAGALSWETPASGGGGGVAGSDTQVQFNDGGAMAGDAGLTFNKTTNYLGVTGGFTDGVGYKAYYDGASEIAYRFRNFADSDFVTLQAWALQAGGSGTYSSIYGRLIIQCSVAGAVRYQLRAVDQDAPGGLCFATGHGVYFGSDTNFVTADIDVGICRNAAGVVEVNNGTAGTLRDILARTTRTTAVAFASAHASPVEGMVQAFTDSSTAAWGATITGGGANHVLGYYNGTNWTVAAK